MKSKKRPAKLTITKLKKVAWVLFSQYIRSRDCLRTTKTREWGLCITCGRKKHFKELQAGHFIPGRHNANLFNETGCHAQCFYCNITLGGNTLEYRRKIVELYGKGYDEELERLNRKIKSFTPDSLQALIDELKIKIGGLQE